jgi:hypothetical protein
VCHFFKAVFAKELMFFLLEILCHCVVLMSRHETSQNRSVSESANTGSRSGLSRRRTLMRCTRSETLVSAIKGIFERRRLPARQHVAAPTSMVRSFEHGKKALWSMDHASSTQFVVRTTLPTDPDGQPIALGIGLS